MIGITHKFIGWMNDASYKYSGVVGNMDAKSPKNAVDRWMNDGSKKYAVDGWWVNLLSVL